MRLNFFSIWLRFDVTQLLSFVSETCVASALFPADGSAPRILGHPGALCGKLQVLVARHLTQNWSDFKTGDTQFVHSVRRHQLEALQKYNVIGLVKMRKMHKDFLYFPGFICPWLSGCFSSISILCALDRRWSFKLQILNYFWSINFSALLASIIRKIKKEGQSQTLIHQLYTKNMFFFFMGQ